MKELLDAIAALLADQPAHVLSAPSPVVYPYRLVWPSVGTPGPDAPLSGARGHVTGLVGVTSVGETPGAVVILADLARAALGEQEAVPLAVAGWEAQIQWGAFGTARQDEQVLIPDTATHPHIYVDLFRLDANRTPGGA